MESKTKGIHWKIHFICSCDQSSKMFLSHWWQLLVIYTPMRTINRRNLPWFLSLQVYVNTAGFSEILGMRAAYQVALRWVIWLSFEFSPHGYEMKVKLKTQNKSLKHDLFQLISVLFQYTSKLKLFNFTNLLNLWMLEFKHRESSLKHKLRYIHWPK